MEICAGCGKSGAEFRKCARCKDVAYCGRECQKRDWKVRHKRICDDGENPQNEPKVKVAKSSRHEFGLFATEKIAKGEKVAFFAGDDRDGAVKVTMTRTKEGVLGLKNAEDVFRGLFEAEHEVDNCLSHPNPDKQLVRIGDRESRSGFGLGQFINDGLKPDLETVDDYESARNELQKYESKSRELANCEVFGSQFWFRSTREIEEGEELLTHYGCEFWLNKAMLAEKESATRRFLLYSLQEQDRKAFNLRNCFNYDKATCEAFLKVVVRRDSEKDVEEVDPLRAIIDLTERIKIL